MESKNEEKLRLMTELGEAMNENFSKEEMGRLYHFLTKIKQIASWTDTEHNYVDFKDVIYLGNKKVHIQVINVKSRGVRDEEYTEKDRKAVEIKIDLPIETTQDNGMKSNKISLSSTGNHFGGMFYSDFLEFLKLYEGWIRIYNKDMYKYSNSSKDDFDLDLDERPRKKKGNWFSNLFKKKKETEEYYDPDEE